MAYSTFTYRDKCIIHLKVKEGDMKLKKWNPETKKVEQTNEVRHWKCQTFSIPLGTIGKLNLGYIDCEYWGDQQLIEGQYIQVGQYFIKQKSWTQKDPKTFIEVKKTKIILVLKDFDKLIVREKTGKAFQEKQQFIKENQSPEQLIKLGEWDMNKDFGNLDIKEEPKEELVSVNDEFDKLIENYNKE